MLERVETRAETGAGTEAGRRVLALGGLLVALFATRVGSAHPPDLGAAGAAGAAVVAGAAGAGAVPEPAAVPSPGAGTTLWEVDARGLDLLRPALLGRRRFSVEGPAARPRALRLGPPARDAPPPPPSFVVEGGHRIEQRLSLSGVDHVDRSRTRLATRAALRLPGADSWAVDWSTSVGWEGLDTVDADGEDPDGRFQLHRFVLTRRFDGAGFVRAGIGLSEPLPGTGRVDGAHGELQLGSRVRVGVLAGARTRREELEFESDESVGVVYVGTRVGRRRRLYYGATVGVLGSVFEGEPDRCSLLLLQEADIGSRLGVKVGSELNTDAFDTGAVDAFQLARLNVCTESPLFSFLTLRAGVDHVKRPDTRTSRGDGLAGEDRMMRVGSWRYWVGCRQSLPGRVEIDGEVAFLSGPEDDGYEDAFRLSLRRTGLPAFPEGRVSASFRDVREGDLRGLRTVLGASLPFLEKRLVVRPQVELRVRTIEEEEFEPRVLGVSVDAAWRQGDRWELHAGVGYSFESREESTVFDVALRCYW